VYQEEYLGSHNSPAWIAITESEYQQNRLPYGFLLPTMAILTVKNNKLGELKRAKYQIVALGNLDPNEWTKAACFAPIMSQKELRLLTAIAVKRKCILKNGDVKQAFVQALLPPSEIYVLKPPPGCPLTPKNTYWLFK